jgi:ABC-type proline/glycine betaine transport system permease subunit
MNFWFWYAFFISFSLICCSTIYGIVFGVPIIILAEEIRKKIY